MRLELILIVLLVGVCDLVSGLIWLLRCWGDVCGLCWVLWLLLALLLLALDAFDLGVIVVLCFWR